MKIGDTYYKIRNVIRTEFMVYIGYENTQHKFRRFTTVLGADGPMVIPEKTTSILEQHLCEFLKSYQFLK